jgi:SAM-dependent methyltransferase
MSRSAPTGRPVLIGRWRTSLAGGRDRDLPPRFLHRRRSGHSRASHHCVTPVDVPVVETRGHVPVLVTLSGSDRDLSASDQDLSGSDQDRVRLSSTFDRAAELYDKARPEYPDDLFEALAAAAGLRSGDRLLEVGSGTGRATLPLARRGLRITALEPGHNLAMHARRNLRGFEVDVVETSFEDWEADRDFALVFAATSWHWIDPAVKYTKAWRVLRSGGHLAFWSASHVFPDGGDQLFRQIQPVYDEIGAGIPSDAPWPRPGELGDDRADIEASGLFEVVDIRAFDWESIYDAEGYIELLATFSGHISMEEWQRDRLYGEIRDRLAQRADGLVRRHWGAVLHVARKRA